MNFMISASTDIGLTKHSNQDSLSVRIFNSKQGKMVFAILCDGMGGLAKGEIASASLVHAFCRWTEERLPVYCQNGITDLDIQKEWIQLSVEYNEKIKTYARERGISMGTTLTAMLLTQEKYYIVHVGDTRAYEISNQVTVLTKDQTVAAYEVEQGNLTPEEAKKDFRRSVLLQCIGASEIVSPDIYCGKIKENTVYLLCSDGFRHEITEDEIYQFLNPANMTTEEEMKKNMDELIRLNKIRQERDNISVLSIRTF